MKGNVNDAGNGMVWVNHNWLCNRFRGLLSEDLFFASTNLEGYIRISKFKLDKLETEKAEYDKRVQLLNRTAELNNRGREQEKKGDITGAIQTYEQNIKMGYAATYSFERLMILYRKMKDYDNEERVIKKAIAIFSDNTLLRKYRDRLEKVRKYKDKALSKSNHKT